MDTMNAEEICRQHALKVKTQEGREKLREAVPALAIRVFALRQKNYPGCGFHYGLVKTVGGLLYRLNNFDESYKWLDLLVDKILYEELVDDVTKAEAHLDVPPLRSA
jgi:hypothetical protein